MAPPLIRGVARHMRDQAAFLTLGGGAGGRSLGSIFLHHPYGCLSKRPAKRMCRSAGRDGELLPHTAKHTTAEARTSVNAMEDRWGC